MIQMLAADSPSGHCEEVGYRIQLEQEQHKKSIFDQLV